MSHLGENMMTQQTSRKPKLTFTPDQKLEYAKLMVEEGYTNQKVMEISGACASAVMRWKKQYLGELNGQTPVAKAMTEDQRTIQELRKQLAQAQRDNEILKKAAAFFIRDNKQLG
jgi:transposase